uniref:Uncharacterized protein n=1 Tax=Glossina brevipalpis TaxID=37001 RepID=A0A1A9WZB4_9MUSC
MVVIGVKGKDNCIDSLHRDRSKWPFSTHAKVWFNDVTKRHKVFTFSYLQSLFEGSQTHLDCSHLRPHSCSRFRFCSRSCLCPRPRLRLLPCPRSSFHSGFRPQPRLRPCPRSGSHSSSCPHCRSFSRSCARFYFRSRSRHRPCHSSWSSSRSISRYRSRSRSHSCSVSRSSVGVCLFSLYRLILTTTLFSLKIIVDLLYCKRMIRNYVQTSCDKLPLVYSIKSVEEFLDSIVNVLFLNVCNNWSWCGEFFYLIVYEKSQAFYGSSSAMRMLSLPLLLLLLLLLPPVYKADNMENI